MKAKLISAVLAFASLCAVAAVARADTLVVRDGPDTYTYTGTTDAITPPYGLLPSQFRFHATEPVAYSTGTVKHPPQVQGAQEWQLFLVDVDGGQINITCYGSLPVYVSGVFSFDYLTDCTPL